MFNFTGVLLSLILNLLAITTNFGDLQLINALVKSLALRLNIGFGQVQCLIGHSIVRVLAVVI